MKRHLFLGIALMLAAATGWAQGKPYNVVFDLTGKDSTEQKALIRWLDQISADHPDARLEVVLYGQSLGLVTQGQSTMADQVKRLTAGKNVSFKVCEIAMKHQNVTKAQLLPGVGTVPDGIYEIISKQGEGYGYIKVAK